MMDFAAPLGAKQPKALPELDALVRSAKPAPAAPPWKQPALFMSTTACSACCQPLVLAKVVLLSARFWFQSASGPYTVEDAISTVMMPVFAGIEPARAKIELPLGTEPHCLTTSSVVVVGVTFTLFCLARSSL